MYDKYSIVVKNHSGSVQNYHLLAEPPKTPYSNVWLRSSGVFSPNGTARFSFGAEVFAVCGTTAKQEPLGHNVKVDTSDFSKVTLATGSTHGTVLYMEVIKDGAGFVGPQGKEATHGGAFGIKTGMYDADKYRHVWCGLGKANSEGEVVPVATFEVKPGQRYTIQPRMRFWITVGTHAQGTVIDTTRFEESKEINFEKGDGDIATLEQKSDGSFTDPVFTRSNAVTDGEMESVGNTAEAVNPES
ncbi:MAG: hypothetical protein MMC33_009424 [Icmadophila ericetorum]|nr:hypothetical protein [Icmadophila ericetorum]